MGPNLIFLLVGLFGFVAVAGLGLALLGGDNSSRTAKRVQAVSSAGRVERQRTVARNSPESASARRKQIVRNHKTAERQERKAKLTLESRIERAGLTMSVRTFWIVCAVCGVVGGAVGVVLSHNPLIALGAAFGVGLGLPRWALAVLCKRRLKKFTAEFPNAIDIIVRGIKSGLPVNDCLRMIASESPEPLGSEFRTMVEGLGMGVSTDQALERMYARVPTSEVRFFAIVLNIQQKTGGNLAEALGNLSVVLRSRKLMGEKIKALSGEAVASAFIIGSLPPAIMIMVTLTTPTYMLPLYTTTFGHMMLLVAAVMMGMGVFIMRRMINFKY